MLSMLSSHATIAADERPKILVFGDSLSAGYGIDINNAWVTLLQQRLDDLGYGYKVVNASISGDTTGSGLRRLPRALRVHQPEIIIIELGGNDGLRATPVMTVRQNLTSMIELSEAAGSRVIMAGIQMPPNYGVNYTDEFTAVFFDVAADTKVDIIPFFLKNIALNPAMTQADGIHPTTEAQPYLLENTWDILEQNLAKPSVSIAN